MAESTFSLALRLLPQGIYDTLYMVFVSGFFALLIGLPLGIALFMSRGKTKQALGTIVNIGRSFPFAILIIAIIPFTRLIVGTSLGTTASIVPLSVAAAPYIARLIEQSLREISPSLLESATIMGSKRSQVITKVLIPESLPSLISNFTNTLVNLVGYSAMAGLVGGGGLGTVAMQYGYLRFNGVLMFWTVVFLILIVQGIQWLGALCQNHFLKKRGLL